MIRVVEIPNGQQSHVVVYSNSQVIFAGNRQAFIDAVKAEKQRRQVN